VFLCKVVRSHTAGNLRLAKVLWLVDRLFRQVKSSRSPSIESALPISVAPRENLFPDPLALLRIDEIRPRRCWTLLEASRRSTQMAPSSRAQEPSGHQQGTIAKTARLRLVSTSLENALMPCPDLDRHLVRYSDAAPYKQRQPRDGYADERGPDEEDEADMRDREAREPGQNAARKMALAMPTGLFLSASPPRLRRVYGPPHGD